MRYQAIIFDLDGTLLDTLADIGNAVNSVLAWYGFATHPIDAYRRFIGDGAATMFDRALPDGKADAATIIQCVDRFRDAYAKHWNVHTKPYDGVMQLLGQLSRRDVKLAVLSNKPHEFTLSCVQQYLGASRFAAVLGQRDSIPRKPDPAGAFEIVAKLGVAASQCLFLGDSPVDVQTARGAGMEPVAVLWGFRSREELESAGATEFIHHPLELLDIIENDV